MRYRIITILAAAAAVLGLALAGPASAASAITPACGATSFCGGQTLDSPDLALAVASAAPHTGTAVIVAVPAASPSQDFLMKNPANPVNNDKSFQLAQSGVPSGLCMSEPDIHVKTLIVLRRCNGSPFQVWTPALFDGSFNAWINNASGFALADPDSGPAGTQLVSRTAGAGTALNELWEFTG